MSDVAPANPLTVTAEQTFSEIERELGAGMVPRIFKLLGAQPELLAHLWGQFRLIILRGQLPRTLKEMIGLIVAVSTHCDYVKIVHMHSLSLQGIDQAALEAIVRGDYAPQQLSSLSREVLRFTALAVATRSSYPSPFGTSTVNWSTLRSQTGQTLATLNLSQEEKTEVLLAIAFFEQICTVANLLELDPAQP